MMHRLFPRWGLNLKISKEGWLCIQWRRGWTVAPPNSWRTLVFITIQETRSIRRGGPHCRCRPLSFLHLCAGAWLQEIIGECNYFEKLIKEIGRIVKQLREPHPKLVKLRMSTEFNFSKFIDLFFHCVLKIGIYLEFICVI